MYSQDNIMGQDARRVKGPRVEEGEGKGVDPEIAGLLTLEIPILIGFGLRFRLDFEVKLRLRLRRWTEVELLMVAPEPASPLVRGAGSFGGERIALELW